MNRTLPSENNENLLRRMFAEVFIPPAYDEAAIHRYFSNDYRQSVDGRVLDLNQLCQHVRVQKQALKELKIEFKTLLSGCDVVFSNHVARAESMDGRSIQIHVIAEFRFRDGKIIACDELSHLIDGDPHDGDLGSRL